MRILSLIELLAKARISTEQTFKQNGRVISMLYVHDTGGRIMALEFKSDKASEENLIKRTIVRAIHTMRIRGEFAGATLTAEAWFSVVAAPDGKMPKKYTRPIDDPKRMERLIAGAWDRDGNSALQSSHITRLGKATEISKWEPFNGRLETWLDSAFVDAAKAMRS